MILFYLILSLLPVNTVPVPKGPEESRTVRQFLPDRQGFTINGKHICITEVYREDFMQPSWESKYYVDVTSVCYTVECLEEGENVRFWIYKGMIWHRVEFFAYCDIRERFIWFKDKRGGESDMIEEAIAQMLSH